MKKIILSMLFAAAAFMGVTAQTTDKTIVITSDWHLSDARSYDANCYYAWTDLFQGRILDFLNMLSDKKDTWDELVLDGDIFEFWRSPVDKFMTADEDGKVLDDVEYLKRIKKNNAQIFDALEVLHNEGKKIVYLPGNHDLNVSQAELEKVFDGLFDYAFDTDATGIYEPFGEGSPVVIEHGSRYEYFNSPYPHGGLGTADETKYGPLGTVTVESTSTLPPGYFTAEIDASATVLQNTAKALAAKAKNSLELTAATEEETDSGNYSLISLFWEAIHAGRDIPSYTVKTRIDGIGTAQYDSCVWKNYAVFGKNNPRLFPDSWKVDNWKKRCELNKVPVYIPFPKALLASGFMAEYDNVAFYERLQTDKVPSLICVWGHSHKKQLITRHDANKGDVLYLNDGAWVDGAGTCNYGVIRYTADNHQYAVELRQFDSDSPKHSSGTTRTTDAVIKDILYDCRYIYVPENNSTKLSDGTWQFNAKAVLLDPEITGINEISNGNTAETSKKAIYSLSGQRLSAPVRGINIIGGKKYFCR